MRASSQPHRMTKSNVKMMKFNALASFSGDSSRLRRSPGRLGCGEWDWWVSAIVIALTHQSHSPHPNLPGERRRREESPEKEAKALNFIIFTLLFVILCGWLDARIDRKSSH